MRIAIDMRMAGTGEGIARYIEELVKNLAALDKRNTYLLLGGNGFEPTQALRNPNFRVVNVRSPYYSLAEQIRLPREISALRPDLVHFPNFNVPLLYRGRFVVTIHDLIHHIFPGKKKPRWFRRVAYRTTIYSAVARSAEIITVSQTTADTIARTFRVPREKITAIYEGVGDEFRREDATDDRLVLESYGITRPYLLFLGVWRQYKNVPLLAAAFDILKEQGLFAGELILAGKIDPFYPEIKEKVMSIKHAKSIRALGEVREADMPQLYANAEVFVLPSLIEGFGLTGLEAQAAGAPVVASDIPVLREVLGGAAFYFDPHSAQDLADSIGKVLGDKALRGRLGSEGEQKSREYNWEKTAKETLGVYERALRKS